ncbi:hypothetical protein TVAG_417050 [Trichomonas vaginalis G3]|uniref:Uncharacterized protein n=1 Tax=Trichomonas vaginalis (strain ATCC PRA-98 / G3) TaxID=412133 RepID=A2ESG3_TRIV3|nr:hypothetical protein TVAGG3_0277900 [Trichomonas vaginalis G3]EAY04407.1 hypothetical protein TVAG_417050 [Trichomonas vaginalis G3]KAI5526336.1 hypothetical protein TVAGG3_0277900 [Trichomonas vaginalis G3]|eukprot:XP_001316630.1 hypothetical protein [Trichomonas vaginalis G3]
MDMLTLRCIRDSSSDSDEEFTSAETSQRLANKLFVNDDEIDEAWLEDIEKKFNRLSPEDQHDICYCLVSRLLRSIKFLLLERKGAVNIVIQDEGKEEEETEEDQTDPLADCDQVDISFEKGLDMLKDEDEEVNNNQINNCKRNSNKSQEIQKLSRRLNKWRQLARDRLSQLEEDIEFRNRLINSLTISNR